MVHVEGKKVSSVNDRCQGSGRRLEWIQMEIMECSGGEWEIWVEIMVIQVKEKEILDEG